MKLIKYILSCANFPGLLRLHLAMMGVCMPYIATAELLGPQENIESWLSAISIALDPMGIDVTSNLNTPELAGDRNDRPRLGKFPDLPKGLYPDSAELETWEQEFSEFQIGSVALIGTAADNPVYPLSYDEFVKRWFATKDEDRVFVSFHQTDANIAENVFLAARELGFYTLLFLTEPAVDNPARLYATAGQRMAIDSRQARRARSQVKEIDFLGESTRNDSNSIFKDNPQLDRQVTRNEPALFRKESLGDEYEASTIPEIIVPGGVALGELATLPFFVSGMEYVDDKLWLLDDREQRWELPTEDVVAVRSLYDFAQRSEVIGSDAIVDIDAQGRVKISSALSDTDIGYEFVVIDTEPFKFVRGLPVNKSVIIDKAIDYIPVANSQQLTFTTQYEIRFLAADSLRIAQSRVALEFEYDSLLKESTHSYSWGDGLSRLDENLDYAGLAKTTAKIGDYAAWVALFRRVERESIRFLLGRYEFLKLDKKGRQTPRRF